MADFRQDIPNQAYVYRTLFAFIHSLSSFDPSHGALMKIHTCDITNIVTHCCATMTYISDMVVSMVFGNTWRYLLDEAETCLIYTHSIQ